ncbi:MAG: nucleotide-binding protein [Lachnospiraceae bacterium]|nr:nucleotide-binding protein [Lachnospiraceae bacterium]
MKIFIGSSSEAKILANYLKEIVEQFGVEANVWFVSDIFVGSSYTLDNLREAAKWYEGALFIWNDDDELISRNEKYLAARDNVIFETGMFMGRLGKECVGICIKKKC